MGKSWEHGGTNHHQWRFERKKHWTSGLSGLSIVLKYQRIYPEAISIQKACQNVAQKMPQNHPSLKLCTHWNHLSSVPKPCVVPLCSLVDRDSLLMDCDTPQYIYIYTYIYIHIYIYNNEPTGVLNTAHLVLSKPPRNVMLQHWESHFFTASTESTVAPLIESHSQANQCLGRVWSFLQKNGDMQY